MRETIYNVFGAALSRSGKVWYLVGTSTDKDKAIAIKMAARDKYCEVVICEGKAWSPGMEA